MFICTNSHSSRCPARPVRFPLAGFEVYCVLVRLEVVVLVGACESAPKSASWWAHGAFPHGFKGRREPGLSEGRKESAGF